MATSRLPARMITLGFGRASMDLTVIVATLAATALAVVLNWPPIVRAPLAFLSVFVVPGYTLALALFPAGASTLDGDDPEGEGGLPLLDRGVLSVASSLSLVAVVGVAVNFSPAPVSTASLLIGLVAATAVVIPVALYRRLQVPAGERFAPLALRGHRGTSPATASGSRRRTLLRALVALSVVFAGGAVTYSTVMADGDGSVTEFYFTGPSDGDLETADYPTNLTTDESEGLTLAVGNRNDREVTYSVIGQLQRVERQDGDLVVRERQRIYSERLTVSAGATETLDTTVAPDEAGRYRLVYLLYTGDPPGEPRMDTAHREIHLWIGVDEPADTAA